MNLSVVSVWVVAFLMGLLPMLVYFIWRVATASKYEHVGAAKPPPVAIVVPTYNGADTIRDTLISLRDGEYSGARHLIVVDDGSQDDTLDIVQEVMRQGMPNRMTWEIMRHPSNQGKRAALKTGILRSQELGYSFVVTVDDDTIVSHNGLERLMARFSDPRVGCVTGNVKVRNNINHITGIACAEYWWALNFVRTGQTGIGSVLIGAGCFSAYRNRALEKTDSWNKVDVAEDYDLSAYILTQGWRNEYAVDAPAYTKSPGNFTGLWRQRLRWCRGFIQVSLNRPKLLNHPRTAIEFLVTLLFGSFGLYPEILALFLAGIASPIVALTVWFAINHVGIWMQCSIASLFEVFPYKKRYLLILPLYQMLIMKPNFIYASLTAWKTTW